MAYSVNCECLSLLSHPNELNFNVVGSCGTEKVHISHKITLDTFSSISVICCGTDPGSVAWWQCLVLPWRILVDICKLHFDACEFHFSDNGALCNAIILTLPDKENFLGLFSRCKFTDQSKLLFICSHVVEGLLSLSLIPSAYHNTVE